jgi:hypothetical protein
MLPLDMLPPDMLPPDMLPQDMLPQDMLPLGLWPNGARPSSEDAMAGAVRAALTGAVALARAGDCRGARQVCAAVVLEAQPIIAARKELLAVALHALLVAKGFKLLSSVVRAVSGRSVQVILLPEDAGPIAPPLVREEPWRTTYVLDPRWLARLAPDDMFVQHWCDVLSTRETGRAVVAEPEPVLRHLEPV